MYKAFDRTFSRIVDFRTFLMYLQSNTEGPWVICESVDAPAQFRTRPQRQRSTASGRD